MHDNPWSFVGFMVQIGRFPNVQRARYVLTFLAVCITMAPVFMTAAIYITLYKR